MVVLVIMGCPSCGRSGILPHSDVDWLSAQIAAVRRFPPPPALSRSCDVPRPPRWEVTGYGKSQLVQTDPRDALRHA